VSDDAAALTGLASNRLEVELTESTLVVDFPPTRQVIRTLKRAGVRINMDDFGTGYSCLRHLRELQFDKVKIDRSFVSGLLTDTESAVIVSAVAGLGRGLDIGIVAEGVENDEQLKMVRAAGCTHAQGFLLGQPRPAAECQATCGTLLIRHVDWATCV
jgi:diguanylate cyclase